MQKNILTLRKWPQTFWRSDTFGLNKKLFSHYPFPEYGGTVRQNNTLVMGAKFETIDYHEIYNELAVPDKDVKSFHKRCSKLSVSEYIKYVVRTHHRLTVIHTFSDGNGRTFRAFMNTQFVRAGLPPIYILVEDKPEYIKALARADKEGIFDDLYEIRNHKSCFLHNILLDFSVGCFSLCICNIQFVQIDVYLYNIFWFSLEQQNNSLHMHRMWKHIHRSSFNQFITCEPAPQ